MHKKDLELAKSKLIDEDFSLVIVKQKEVIFETQKKGIMGFLEAIESLDKNLMDSSVADRIVGVAAAMLCVYAGVASVFALTISKKGRKILRDNNIEYRYEKTVPNILNRNKEDMCPFEKLAMISVDPEDAFDKLKSCATQKERHGL